MRRMIGMDVHRTFAEVAFWEGGRLRWPEADNAERRECPASLPELILADPGLWISRIRDKSEKVFAFCFGTLGALSLEDRHG